MRTQVVEPYWGVRPFEPQRVDGAEYRFVVSTWLESFRSSDWARRFHGNNLVACYSRILDPSPGRPTTPYHIMHRALIERILQKAAVRIAFFEEDEDTILGYSVVEGHALHYVKVKDEHQGVGIATSLIPKGNLWASHVPDTINRKRVPGRIKLPCDSLDQRVFQLASAGPSSPTT